MDTNTTNAKLNVCHTSEFSIVKVPDWKYRSPNPEREPEKKDFGIGFYMCETKDQTYPIGLKSGYEDVYLNEYVLDLTGLSQLKLQVNLLWVMVVAAHRRRNARARAIFRGYWQQLADILQCEVAKHDIIIAPISNDRFFSLLDDFIDGAVAEDYTIEAANYMRFPMQYVSKSDKTDKQATFQSGRKLSYEELKSANELWVSEHEEMTVEMTRRRLEERSNVEQGKVSGRLFSDIVNSCFIGIENAVGEEKEVHLAKLVRGWFRDEKC